MLGKEKKPKNLRGLCSDCKHNKTVGISAGRYFRAVTPGLLVVYFGHKNTGFDLV